MSMITTIAGIAWDPNVSGLLAVLTGVVVLMGSVWYLVSTNSGVRVGTLLAFAAFFGWMFIMSTTWWMYGKGWQGDSPSWQTIDINVGDLGASGLMKARELPNPDELNTGYELVILSGNARAMAEFGTLPTAADNPDVSADALAALQADRQLRNETVTRSELASVSPDITEAAGWHDLNGWRLLPTTESGDAQARAVADILSHPDLGFVSTADFKLLDAYSTGGKPRLTENPNRIDRITHWIANSARITHPTRYTVVQLQRVLDQPTIAGEAPPRPVVDEAEPVVSIIMVRDLGSVRLRPALVMIGSLLIFLALCYWLHVRDKEHMARRREFENAKA
jgi:hypothetical protein